MAILRFETYLFSLRVWVQVPVLILSLSIAERHHFMRLREKKLDAAQAAIKIN
jgi:hypothetical protein